VKRLNINEHGAIHFLSGWPRSTQYATSPITTQRTGLVVPQPRRSAWPAAGWRRRVFTINAFHALRLLPPLSFPLFLLASIVRLVANGNSTALTLRQAKQQGARSTGIGGA
jgi:hypothetical protein